MYENINGEQFKALPENEKKQALAELQQLYPDRKELTEHMGIKNTTLGIWISKYVEGKKIGREKGIPSKSKQSKKIHKNYIEYEKPQTTESKFKISVNNSMNGQEAKVIIGGLTGSLLDTKNYSIKLTIEEVEVPAE
jgi:hypothetical protein